MSQPKNFQNDILILVPVKSLHFNSNNKHSGRSRNSPVTEPSYRDKLRIITSEPSINIKPTYSAISFVLGNKKIDFFSSAFYSITWLLFSLQGLFVRCQSVFLRQFVKAGRANHLCEKRPVELGVFWSVFPLIRAECGDLQSKSSNSLQIWKSKNQKKSIFGQFSHSECFTAPKSFSPLPSFDICSQFWILFSFWILSVYWGFYADILRYVLLHQVIENLSSSRLPVNLLLASYIVNLYFVHLQVKYISNPVKYLIWSVFAEIVNGLIR